MDNSGNYLILFADLIGSTEVAVEVAPSFYAQTYVSSYHWAARRAMAFVESKAVFPSERFSKVIRNIQIAGDEVLSFTPLDDENDSSKEDIVASAIAFAYVTKLYWLVSPYNLRRMIGRQFPRDMAVGIHIGPAAIVPAAENKERIASLHINVTKRVEGKARDGKESRIFASYEVYDHFDKWLRRVKKSGGIKDRSPLSFTFLDPREDLDKVKGMPKKLQLLELKWPANDPDLTTLLKQLADTPEQEDIETEKAARFLAENFLLYPKNPFSYDKGKTSAISYNRSELGSNAVGYINKWFESVKELNKLFFDECWLVLNCYLLSCSLLRYKGINQSNINRYQRIAKNILLPRLKDLMERQKAK